MELGIQRQVVQMSVSREFDSGSIVTFLVIAYGISWGIWSLVYALMIYPLPPEYYVMEAMKRFAAPFGPLVAAVLLTHEEKDFAGVKELMKSGFDVPYKRVWLIPVLFLMPAIVALSLIITILLGGVTPELAWLSESGASLAGLAGVLIVVGPIQQEFGWRGYVLPRLQGRFNALVSSLILGVLWALWHLPLFDYLYSQHAGTYFEQPIWIIFVSLIFTSILCTWVYNNTDGNILCCILLNTSLYISLWLFPVLDSSLGAIAYTVLLAIAAFTAILYWGPRCLTGRALSHRSKSQDTRTPNGF